ncbi:uncharacterized protein K452DRAFT_301632 [Aplosporella prunicola CBS 121167]|uniref:Uncharacterized protein n=1 Tax=Aplosporella prunicola CBS 121167 TaxID=1176127 RepID=A0A6A6B275_9PEZI|nr:uncharacterized protein K452DRAFT_301632 [Aplosporella prunicola CBS 121167]KAF2137916.1 hypothetical protein K452DRAFT_301632 [Aplosporella prunicola CBS 121167]
MFQINEMAKMLDTVAAHMIDRTRFNIGQLVDLVNRNFHTLRNPHGVECFINRHGLKRTARDMARAKRARDARRRMPPRPQSPTTPPLPEPSAPLSPGLHPCRRRAHARLGDYHTHHAYAAPQAEAERQVAQMRAVAVAQFQDSINNVHAATEAVLELGGV